MYILFILNISGSDLTLSFLQQESKEFLQYFIEWVSRFIIYTFHMTVTPINNWNTHVLNWFINLSKRQISNSSVRLVQNLSVCFKWAGLLTHLQEFLDAGPPAHSPAGPSSDWFINVLCVCRKLQFQPLSAEVPVLFRVVELPQKQHLCKVKSLNKGDANSEVTVYYQVGKQTNYKLINT